MPIQRLYLGIALIISLSNCSARQVYEVVQENRWQQCEEQPIPLQASCKAQYETDYDEYVKLRISATDSR